MITRKIIIWLLSLLPDIPSITTSQYWTANEEFLHKLAEINYYIPMGTFIDILLVLFANFVIMIVVSSILKLL